MLNQEQADIDRRNSTAGQGRRSFKSILGKSILGKKVKLYVPYAGEVFPEMCQCAEFWNQIRWWLAGDIGGSISYGQNTDPPADLCISCRLLLGWL